MPISGYKLPMSQSRSKKPAESETARRERQAEMLRENLRRRKEQARSRLRDPAAEGPAAAVPGAPDK